MKKFSQEKAVNSIKILKHGFLQQRRKLNYKAFTYLNKEYLQEFYLSNESVLWNNFKAFAIDASKAEVLNSNENRTALG